MQTFLIADPQNTDSKETTTEETTTGGSGLEETTTWEITTGGSAVEETTTGGSTLEETTTEETPTGGIALEETTTEETTAVGSVLDETNEPGIDLGNYEAFDEPLLFQRSPTYLSDVPLNSQIVEDFQCFKKIFNAYILNILLYLYFSQPQLTTHGVEA